MSGRRVSTAASRTDSVRAGKVGTAMADVVAGRGGGDLDGAVGVGGAARGGVVGQEILGTELAVDAIEDGAQLLGRVGIEHGAAGGVGHGFQSVFTGGVAAAFAFHRGGGDGVKERVWADGLFSRPGEIRAGGGFAPRGKHNGDATAGPFP